MNLQRQTRAAAVSKIAVFFVAACLVAAAFFAAPATGAYAAAPSAPTGHILPENLLKGPPNCTVNLIDYWANSATVSANPVEYGDESGENATWGINANHYLIFGQQDYGAWNAWTNNASENSSHAFSNVGLDGNGKAYRGIVNYNLGDDGYPRLALGEYAWLKTTGYDNSNLSSFNRVSGTRVANESLAYLFNPDNTTDAYSHTARRGYADVKGLFRYGGTSGTGSVTKDMSGYYWYDSNVNFAEMRAKNADGADFDYYDSASYSSYGATATYSINLYDTALSRTNSFAGQFLPLNYVNRDGAALFTVQGNTMTAQTSYDTVRARANHYFGLSMEVEFMQPAGYRVDGKDMTFTFAGDDDVWIFCDDVLVADLGGNHNSIACDINFTTGEIIYYSSQSDRAAYNGVWRVDYLSNCFGVDLSYGREAKGWTKTGTVPANVTALQRMSGTSGRSGEDLHFGGATTNATYGSDYGTFEELTRHTLKFYFLEGGNYSNCMLKFNLSAIAE